MDENAARTLLRAVADVQVPPARVDLDRAIADGRRQRRIRRAGTACSAIAVVAAAAVIAASGVLGASARREQVVPAAPRHTAPLIAPSRLNPLVPYAAFGWLPGGYTVASALTGPASTTRSVQLAAARKGGRSDIQLTVDALGACTGRLTCAGTDASTLHMRGLRPAAAVDGRPAYWAADEYVGGYLVWQYAPGAWASLHVQRSPSSAGPPPAAERATLERIAAHVRYDTATPLTVPYWIRLPAGWTAGQTQYSLGPSGTLTGGALLVGPAGDPLAADLVVGTPTSGNCKGEPNTTLDDAPATLQEPGQSPVYQSLCAEKVDGLTVYVSLQLSESGGAPVAGAGRLGGALGLARDLHLLGDRVSAWTTHPLR